jgi:phosphoribosylformimino-5-aminoimidazole carboxamide ribotide isomerase
MEGSSKPSGRNLTGSRLSSFTIFPAIDLRDGRCVRLKQGDFERSKEYDADPVERAREWERRGAQAIHVVDLDGAREGRPAQLDLLREMAGAVEVPLQVGGGVRTLEDLRALRGVGAIRVVMGTAAVGDRDLRLRAVEELGPELVVAVDARDGIVSTHGWQSSSGIAVLEFAEELAADGVGTVLYTDVLRDGMDAGVALERTAAVASLVPTIASGGVRGAEDVVALSKISDVVGVVVGTALYEGRVTLEELLRAASGRGGERSA